jgi:hypothetical protein
MLSCPTQTDLVLVAPQNFILDDIDDSGKQRTREDGRQEIAERVALGAGGRTRTPPRADA